MEVVIKMPNTIKVDKQGRMVLPVEVRRALGVVQGGSIVLKKKNSRIFIDAGGGELEKNAKLWKEKLKSTHVEAKGFEAGESKWLSEDWAKKKLGIQA